VKAGGSLGCSDHEMVEFRILYGGSRAISRITALDFRRANFGLFKDLLGGIPWVRALEGRGIQESWFLLSISSSMIRIGASHSLLSSGVRNLAKEAGDPHGQERSY